MFIGVWRANYRVCSIYCTFGVCLFQFAALIACGAMMFTDYNKVCARSMKETMGDGNIWTMADDFYMTFSLWVISFITMFCFVCCGLCSAIKKWTGSCLEKWIWAILASRLFLKCGRKWKSPHRVTHLVGIEIEFLPNALFALVLLHFLSVLKSLISNFSVLFCIQSNQIIF